MNSTLFKQVKVWEPESPIHGKVYDILITDGQIAQIAEKLESDAETFEREGLCVSIGWVDLLSSFMDPGFEHKETVQTGLDAAAAGGFTKVAILPDTDPVIDSGAQVNHLFKKAEGHITEILPIGALTKDLDGKHLAEMVDMMQTGAVAFCDGKQHLANADLMRIAMLYGKGAKAAIWSFPKDAKLHGNGQINESEFSAALGLSTTPALAEDLAVARDLMLAEYTESPIHFAMISSAGSVELIKNAQKKGIKATAAVSSHHLMYTENDLAGLDSNLKTDLPLRTEADREALIQGLKDGVITCVVSDHRPQDIECKQKEFGLADEGMINLQTSFAAARSILSKGKEIDSALAGLTTGPRRALGLPNKSVLPGADELTFFCPDETWQFTKENNRSLSNNSPMFDVDLKGRAVAICNRGRLEILV